MGMDISGINPTITGEEPVFPDNFRELSDKARAFYWEIKNDWDEANPGVYFRANVWSWRPIHMAICCANEMYDLEMSDDLLDGISHNSGYGLKDQEHCDKLANALNDMIEGMKESNIERFGFNMGMWNCKEDTFLKLTKKEEDSLNIEFPRGQLITDFPIKLGTRKKSLEIYPSHITSVEHVEEFIQFLKHCGGFEVW